MARQRPFLFSLIVLISAALLACAYAPASGQRSSVTRGAMVRVSRPDSLGQPIWSTGRVVYLSSDRLLLAEADGDPLVRLNEAIRLEVRRSQSKSLLGGLFGLGIGSLAGWWVGHSAGDEADATVESIAGALVGGIAGASIGALLGKRIRSTRWEEVALEGGRLASASLDREPTRPDVPRFGTYRWNRFDPTPAEFEAFFRDHAQNLHPVEGIWARHASFTRVAIVRVGGPDDGQFVAFTVVHPPGRPVHRTDGLMLFALEVYPDGDKWYVRFPGETPRRFRAKVDEWMLELEYPSGWWDTWEKLFPD